MLPIPGNFNAFTSPIRYNQIELSDLSVSLQFYRYVCIEINSQVWLGTIHILRHHIFGLFRTHHVSTNTFLIERKQNLPFLNPSTQWSQSFS